MFKVGDRVVGTDKALSHRVGMFGVITHVNLSNTFWVRWGEEYNGTLVLHDQIELVKEELMYKVGDKVEITDKNHILGSHGFKIGEVVRLDKRSSAYDRDGVKAWMSDKWVILESEFKKVEEMQYEYKWHLNGGSVEIPDSAEKLMNPEGTSVVAFRYSVGEVVYTRWIARCDTDFNSYFNKKYAESTGRPVTEVKYTFRNEKLVKVHIVN